MDEEEFSLFLRSLLHAGKDLLDEVESECGIYGGTDALRIPFQQQLFHCLALQCIKCCWTGAIRRDSATWLRRI
ncbi:MAG: hypothetical protein LUE24_03465 [Lachnospiraceae bacterium]|nr:hypothetical protein [Lachnospiraceae bacterium]